MDVVLWAGFALWFPGVGLMFVSRRFKRSGRESRVMEAAAGLSVIGAVLLAISVPVVSTDPVWQRVLYDAMLIGWMVMGVALIAFLRQARVVERLNVPEA